MVHRDERGSYMASVSALVSEIFLGFWFGGQFWRAVSASELWPDTRPSPWSYIAMFPHDHWHSVTAFELMHIPFTVQK